MTSWQALKCGHKQQHGKLIGGKLKMLQHLTALAESTGDDLLSLIGQSFDITAQLESLSLPRILLALLTATL